MTRRDPVTPEMRILVFTRDQYQMTLAGFATVTPTCVAPIIDPKQRGLCWGRSTIEHVKDEPRAGVRADSDLEHMVSLCQGHTEDGMKAGFIWNTAHRPELRDYLARANVQCPRCAVILVGPKCLFCGLPRPEPGAAPAEEVASAQ